MAISFDTALGIHQQAIQVRADRAEVLANNIANADTPNYLSRDLDFKAILNGEVDKELKLMTTNSSHSANVIHPDFAAELMYRVPTQPSVDGNTVDVQEEMAAFGQNTLAYQASFEFLNGKFKGLKLAIKGSA
ncbi:MAG: flagellar basal body rod protein FlgB [Oceanospirillaceae bacterium]|nr:flagellar basal body rod protein FlgB [Oceanospirillaceae bacterium]